MLIIIIVEARELDKCPINHYLLRINILQKQYKRNRINKNKC